MTSAVKGLAHYFNWGRLRWRKAPGLRCSFCSKIPRDIQKIHSGPEQIIICDKCLNIAAEIIGRETLTAKPCRLPENLACSFCLKTEEEVTKLVAGPSAYICDQCVKGFLRESEVR